MVEQELFWVLTCPRSMRRSSSTFQGERAPAPAGGQRSGRTALSVSRLAGACLGQEAGDNRYRGWHVEAASIGTAQL